MYRKIIEELRRWKEADTRKPLILKGVRQCGKTWILQEFAKNNFEDVAYVNFETDPRLRDIFDRDLNVGRIIRELGDFRHKRIDPAQTVLIFDEIQACPPALTSLKYFHENMPELAILCAGSLLGIALAAPLSFPVGKVTFLTLYPMNFEEFLLANHQDYLAESLATVTCPDDISPVLFDEFADWYYTYLLVGGFPEAVTEWCMSRNLDAVDAILDNILQSYELDFAKHAPHTEFPRISAVWNAVPAQLAKENRKFVYSSVQSGGRARTLADAVEWLMRAGLIHKVSLAEQPMVPLSAAADLSAFKLYLCDVGLLRRMSRFPAEILRSTAQDTSLMRGALTENFICTELLSSRIPAEYYWKSGNQAEIEFIVPVGSQVVPIEVKAGLHTKGRSLSVYRAKYHPGYAVRFSQKHPGEVTDEYGTLISLPLFVASCLERVCSQPLRSLESR